MIARRSFLKTSTLAAAGLAAASVGLRTAFSRSSGFVTGMQINPDIDNLRVVACCDPSMENSVPLKWDTASQNSVVNAAKVSDVMDAMARALAQKADTQAAWATILKKPDAKAWPDVRIAIKVNCSGLDATTGLHPRAAFINKICSVLNGFGVPFASMVIYDTMDDAVSNFSGFKGTLLPADVVVSNGGDTFPVTVMGEALKCTTLIQNADVLVNIGVNKPHIATWVGLTMTCKNHVGTITRGAHGSNCPQDLTQLFELNKNEAIIGTPSAGVPCRQQLCIVDSLWSSKAGDWSCIPDTPLYYAVMGTFGPAVDYLTTRKIRIDIMNCTTHPDADLNRFITDFGYADADRQSLTTLTPDQNFGRGWVEVPASGIIYGHSSTAPGAQTVELLISGRNKRASLLHVSFPSTEPVAGASVFSPDGRLVCLLESPLAGRFTWDGTAGGGHHAGPGQYYLQIHGPHMARSYHFSYY
ncbi:MAG TPA: DUF362 domain-containing protein [Chitinivibrionales bacterium]|nr:DUF362 domain-containing protein [Chitinivibrionales bacterium]